MRMSVKAVATIGWMTLAGGHAVAAPAPHAAAVAACMTRAAARLGFSGTVYARFGKRVVQRSFGHADAAGRLPNDTLMRFDMGSASKMFTAVAIGQLVDRGLVRFDAPIKRYLPALRPPFAGITVAQLLSHTSGLGNYFKPENLAAIESARTASDLLPLALKTPPKFEPGSRRAYSNSGFVVLGAIIERVSGMSYDAYVRKHILVPLRMRHTRFDARGAATPMTRMSPEGPLKEAVPSPLRKVPASPAGGIYSTPADISAFLTALQDGRLLSRRTLSALVQPRRDPPDRGPPYAYGFEVHAGPPQWVGHGGGGPGANAEVALFPDTGWQLIALSNNDPPTATRIEAVLEKAIFAPAAGPACATALAEPRPER